MFRRGSKELPVMTGFISVFKCFYKYAIVLRSDDYRRKSKKTAIHSLLWTVSSYKALRCVLAFCMVSTTNVLSSVGLYKQPLIPIYCTAQKNTLTQQTMLDIYTDMD